MFIMMTDMTTHPMRAFPSCCGTFSSQNKAPWQLHRGQQKIDVSLLPPLFLFTVCYFFFAFVFSFFPVSVMIRKECYLQNCIACEQAQENSSLPCSFFHKLDPLRGFIAAFVPHQVSRKTPPLIAKPKTSHCCVSVAQRVCTDCVIQFCARAFC